MIPSILIEDAVVRALREDLAGGDLTTEATVATDTRAIARAIAKKPLVVCGADIFARCFYELDPGMRVEALLPEGHAANAGDPLWIVEGDARAILMAERTALNFAQRLSGIATLTRHYVQELPEGATTRITDTRKTTPGLRLLERYAVRVGGASNHRDTLGAAILIKDNHIEAAGGIRVAVERAKAFAPHTSRIEVEVETLAQLDEALEAGADIVLLDNFAATDLPAAVRRAQSRRGAPALVEVSGGVTLERVAELAHAGVDVISVGALTHSAPAADISLEIERLG